MDYRLIFYDFEVKKDWWCCTFGERLPDGKVEYTTVQDKLSLVDFTLRNKDKAIFIGYNNRHFDDYCWKCVWYGINPYKVVDHVIKKGYSPYDKLHPLKDLQFKKNIGYYSFDLMQTIGRMAPSLKEIEANLGLPIVFDKTIEEDKEEGLTKEEINKMIEYNKHDVFTTMTLFDKLSYELKSFMTLINYYKMPMSLLRQSKASMIENIFRSEIKPQAKKTSFKYKTPEFITFHDNQVKDAIENFEFTEDNKFDYDYTFDNYIYKIGRGGAHYAKKCKVTKFGNGKTLICADFGSFYPNMMANKTNESLRIIDSVLDWNNFRSLIDLRLEAKAKGKSGDEQMADLAEALKIPLNGAYGKLIDKYSIMYSWTEGLKVCLTGQLITIMICQELQFRNVGELINVNTDGFYYIVDSQSKYDEFMSIMKNFEKITGISFSYDIINNGVIYQKDVNNYVIYDKDTDHIKTKGTMVNRYKTRKDWYMYSQAIIDEALVKKFCYDIPLRKTIMEAFNNNEARKFQIIYNAKGKNWEGCYKAWYKEDKDKTPWKVEKTQKINRGFAVVDKTAPRLTRLKEGTYCKFEDRPDHIYIWNNDIKDVDIRKIGLDIEWYCKLATKRYNAFVKEED